MSVACESVTKCTFPRSHMVEGSSSHEILGSDLFLEQRTTLLKSRGRLASFDDFISVAGFFGILGETILFLLLRGEKFDFFGNSSGRAFFGKTCIHFNMCFCIKKPYTTVSNLSISNKTKISKYASQVKYIVYTKH